MGEILSERLNNDREAPGLAREHVRDFCRALSPDLCSDVQLVVSELVTNAVIHGADPIVLSLQLTDVGVSVVVGDGGLGRPGLGLANAPDLESGRGLMLVAGLV